MTEREKMLWIIPALVLFALTMATLLSLFSMSPVLGQFCGAQFSAVHYELVHGDLVLLMFLLLLDLAYIAATGLRVLLGPSRYQIYQIYREEREQQVGPPSYYNSAAALTAENERLRRLLKACAL
jgi:hypothetical protein